MNEIYHQRRHLISFASRRLPHIFADVLIIGGGAAGLRAALEACQYGEVIVLSKGSFEDSNTYYAQGGLAAVMDPGDSIDAHIDDTLATGCGLCDEAIVRHCISSAPAAMDELISMSMPFDPGDQDEIALGREGGHSANRVLHADGDATGRVLAETLLARVKEHPNIKLFDHCFALDLMTDPPAGGDESRCVGALTHHARFGLQMIHARQTILAAGGAGMLWRETSNPSIATGDAIAMAFRAGATLMDLEMMQFHPTTLYIAGSSRSLISEAVRGEGGKLVDRDGKRFMDDYHEMAELAPRDVVSRAVLAQMKATGTSKVYLDVRHFAPGAFAKRFPGIDQQCRRFDIDPETDLIPVHPAAHYMIGGVRVDADGKTDLPGLLACWEAACTGLHGANRLASNSLTEALVFGCRTGRTAGESLATQPEQPVTPVDWIIAHSDRTELDLVDIRNALRSVMWRNVGIRRSEQRLIETVEITQFWSRYVMDKEFFGDPSGWEAQNMLTAGYLIASLALSRTESRGVHYRTDHTETDPAWARHQTVRRT